MRKWKGIALLFVFVALASYGQAATGTEGAAFLDIPVGAGPAALGSAYSALAQDAYAPIYNPAGLGFVTNSQLSAQHLSYLESINYEYGSFVVPFSGKRLSENDPGLSNRRELPPAKSALGLSVQYLGSGNFAGTDPSGTSIGSYSAHYAAYSLAYGQKVFDRLSLGFSGKIIEAKLADVSALAYAADVGTMYEATDRLTLSATANNLGSKLRFTSQGDTLPLQFHLGGAYHWQKHCRATLEGVYSKTGLFSERVGAEWSPLEAISIRAGYRTDTTKELSPMAGLTAGIGIHVWSQELAYAWVPYGELGNTQYFSLVLQWGHSEEKRRNLIQFQSIKKHRSAQDSRGAGPNGDSSTLEVEQLIQLLDDEHEQVASSWPNDSQK